MAHKYADELQQISDYLQAGLNLAAQIDIPDLAAIKMRLTSALKREKNFIASLTGNSQSADAPVRLPPLTHMFGEPIVKHAAAPVTKSDIDPTNDERKKFQASVDDWYKNFLNLNDEKIFAAGDLLIRAVAKRSGLDKKEGFEDFDTMDIDLGYIKAIRICIEEKNLQSENLKDADKALKSDKKNKKDQNAFDTITDPLKTALDK